MNDLREELLNNISSRLAFIIDQDELQPVMDAIVLSLERYELSERTTEVGFHNDTSERLLQIYAGSLLTEGKSKKTVSGYIYFLRRFLNDVNMQFVDVRTMDVKIWLAKMQENVSLRTCENYRSYLSAFYMWLANEDYIEKNPMAKIKPIKYVDVIREAFSDVEIDAMRMSITDVRNRAIFETLISSGVRVSELCGLDINDVDFVKKSVLVRNGKGGKQRTTYINDVCLIHLKKYLSTRTDNNPALFMSRVHKRVSVGAVRDILKTIGEEANVANVHPHRCRRTFATTMYARGMDIHTIQKLLGHSNINTTIGYIQTEDSRVSAEYDKCA